MRQLPLLILRSVFLMVSIGIAVLIFNSQTMQEAPQWVPWVVLSGMVALPLTVIAVDGSIRKKNLAVITAVYFGLLIGVFLNYIAILALTPILPTSPRDPITTWLPLILGMVFCYICTSLLIQTRDDFRFLIPYVEFARDVQGLRPNILDASSVFDGRIADLAEAGIFESRFVMPAFVVDEIQAAADSSEKQRRLRGRRGLDILARLQAGKYINIEVLSTDEPNGNESAESRLVTTAQKLDGRIITVDADLLKIASLRKVLAININDLSLALKPTFVAGDLFDVKLTRAGDETGQAVGYLDDGTMVVVENAREQIGHNLSVSVTSTLQTAAGRLVFAKPEVSRA